MVKHIILWQLKDELSESERTKIKKDIKVHLEGLSGGIPGLTDIHVHTEGLETSNADVMLDSAFTDAVALKGYAVHPEHVKVADTYVRPYTKFRCCFDFEI